jgi:hypothetical protein
VSKNVFQSRLCLTYHTTEVAGLSLIKRSPVPLNESKSEVMFKVPQVSINGQEEPCAFICVCVDSTGPRHKPQPRGGRFSPANLAARLHRLDLVPVPLYLAEERGYPAIVVPACKAMWAGPNASLRMWPGGPVPLHPAGERS